MTCIESHLCLIPMISSQMKNVFISTTFCLLFSFLASMFLIALFRMPFHLWSLPFALFSAHLASFYTFFQFFQLTCKYFCCPPTLPWILAFLRCVFYLLELVTTSWGDTRHFNHLFPDGSRYPVSHPPSEITSRSSAPFIKKLFTGGYCVHCFNDSLPNGLGLWTSWGCWWQSGGQARWRGVPPAPQERQGSPQELPAFVKGTDPEGVSLLGPLPRPLCWHQAELLLCPFSLQRMHFANSSELCWQCRPCTPTPTPTPTAPPASPCVSRGDWTGLSRPAIHLALMSSSVSF